jgi:hypothetical protein
MAMSKKRTEVKIEREERVHRRIETMPGHSLKSTREVVKRITLARVPIRTDDEVSPRDLRRK